MTITHTKSPIIQSDDYYPFGLRYNSYSRENTLPNNTKLFQGQEHIDDLGLNWDSFKWRNHQPDIGRFFNIDPLSEKYYYNSPYAFSENKVVSHIELEGLEAIDRNGVAAQDATKQNYVNRPVEIKKKSEGQNDHGTISIGTTSIYHPNARTSFEKAAGTGVEIGSTLTGIYSLKNIASLLKNGKNLLGALAGLGKSEAMMAERVSAAKSFYSQAGFSAERAADHMKSINFEKPVEAMMLNKGTVVQQWVGENGVGNYFTPLENGAAKNLGISYEGRTLQQFTLSEDVNVLQSTAAEFKGNAGGGTQYFSTELKNKIQ